MNVINDCIMHLNNYKTAYEVIKVFEKYNPKLIFLTIAFALELKLVTAIEA